MPRHGRIFVALAPFFFALPGCGGDATAANPDTPIDTTPDAAADATPEATPDADDSSETDAAADSGCPAAATVTVEAHVRYDHSPSPGVDVTAHCADGRFFARTKADAEGSATIEVPAGGLLTASCPESLSTVGGIEEGGSLELTCEYYGPPHARPPTPGNNTYDYTVALLPLQGATSYQVRGNAGSAESIDAGQVTLEGHLSKGDIVAYALDAQSQRIASAAKLNVNVYTGAKVSMGPFVQGVYPASISLINPRVEDAYEYAATLETSRAKTVETESVVSVLGAGEAASLTTHFAANVAQWNSVKVHYGLTDASGEYASDLDIRRAADNLPFEHEIDLTTGMLPLMFAPSLVPAARPLLDFEQAGPAMCVTGPADELIVQLYAKHPNGQNRHWNLQLPGDTSAPWTLPELGTETEQEYWPGEQMTTIGIVVIRQAYEDQETGVPVCTSRSSFPPPPF